MFLIPIKLAWKCTQALAQARCSWRETVDLSRAIVAIG
ncbi:hypothetical protein C4J94_1025 [Pseudomonas sp. R5-89-07]|nr:hypothetical protein C4J94_1025 [Pseudomonas sp. R5-89-07]